MIVNVMIVNVKTLYNELILLKFKYIIPNAPRKTDFVFKKEKIIWFFKC